MEKWTAGIFIGEKALEEKAKRRAETLTNAEAHFKASLEITENALDLNYLEDDDRVAIEAAIHWIEFWLPVFLKSDDPDDVREAGYWIAAYDKVIGSRCEVSKTEEEFWRRQRSAKGGRGEKEKGKKKREAREAWQLYATALEGANTETSITDLAGSLLIDMKRPTATPSNPRTLEKFLSSARKKRLAAGEARPIRLIHSA